MKEKMLEHFSLKVGILPHPTLKYVKTGQFYEIRGKFCKSRGKKKKIPEIEGKSIGVGK